jgi:hypothetical protein
VLNCLNSCLSVEGFLNTSKMFKDNDYNMFDIITKRTISCLDRSNQYYSSDRYRFPLEAVVCVHSLLHVPIEKSIAFKNIVFRI